MLSDDELRALADALEPMARAPRFEDFDVPAFCAWVRACADAQPVAWMHIDGRVISAATMDQAYRDGGAMQSSLRDYTIPLYAHPAPAAPEIKERGPWTDRHTSVQAWIESDDFTHDVRLYVNGDFESNDQRIAYAQEIARRLNAASATPQEK